MSLRRPHWFVIVAGIVAGGCATTGGPPERAVEAAAGELVNPNFPELYAHTRGFSLGAPRSFAFTPDGSTLFFLRSASDSPELRLFAIDASTGEERLAVSKAKLLPREDEQGLSDVERAERERRRVSSSGITSFTISKDGKSVLVPLSGRIFLLDVEKNRIREVQQDAGYRVSAGLSPDERYVSSVRDGELYVYDLNRRTDVRVSPPASEKISYGRSEFIAQEEMGRFEGYWWAPDSARIVFQETDNRPVTFRYVADPGEPEQTPQHRPYPEPGTANASVRLGITTPAGGETTWIDWDRETYPYLVNVRWTENAPLSIQVQNRRQTEIALFEVDPASGAVTELLVEQDPAWVNIDQDMPHWLPDGQTFLWTTERNGVWQLEQRRRNGALLRTLSPEELGYRGLASVSADGKEVVVYASTDPLFRKLYSIFLGPEGTDTTPYALAQEDGYHSAIYAPNHRFHIHRMITAASEPEYRLYDENGESVAAVDDLSIEPPIVPNVEFTTVHPEMAFRVAIVRPREFNARRRYPVIETVYGGPHGNMVQLGPERYLLDQWMADQGFIVVRIDGRGTPHRGRRWERAIQGNLIDAPLADHVNVLRRLGERYPEMDLERVGIHGWSFGGYFTAMAVMRHPELYRAGVAGAPVVDWMDYDTHYTERYLGLPSDNETGYRVSNVLTYAGHLRRPLLLIHGTTDDNVYFVHSLKLSDYLFRSGIDHDFLPLNGFTHMVRDQNAAEQRILWTLRYFQNNL